MFMIYEVHNLLLWSVSSTKVEKCVIKTLLANIAIRKLSNAQSFITEHAIRMISLPGTLNVYRFLIC